MKQPASLIDRVIMRLVSNPPILKMDHFSTLTDDGSVTFCLAGLILDEAGVRMEYDPQLRRALGLAKGERAPAPEWVRYELSIVESEHRELLAQDVLIPARAREIWAAAHGVNSAKELPLYTEDWGCSSYTQITAELVVRYLRAEKPTLRKSKTVASLPAVA